MLPSEQSMVASAGVRADGLNSLAVQVMKEIGVDISNQKSQTLQSVDLNEFNLIVTVCDNAKQTCPFVQNKNKIHKNIIDPVLSSGTIEQQLAVYRKVRNEIKLMVSEIIIKYDDICREQN